MKAELLGTPPISGSVEEHAFAATSGSNAWVRFDDELGDEWIGVFGGLGIRSGAAVVPFGDDGGRTVLVVAHGAVYILDVVHRRLLRPLDRDPAWVYATTAATIPGHAFVAVANDTEAWFAYRDHDRRIWRADQPWYELHAQPPFYRLALDGIRLDGVTGEKLHGKVWQMDGWYALEVELESGRAVIGGCLTREWSAFAAPDVAG
jgi:hypothetical protein